MTIVDLSADFYNFTGDAADSETDCHKQLYSSLFMAELGEDQGRTLTLSKS